METIEFTIFGNQEDDTGNPLGYHRTTQKSKWNPASIKYEEWKGHVQSAFNKSGDWFAGILNMSEKPILLAGRKAYLHTMIYYKNDHRPDPDNVQKGIADALFVNDKDVAGSYDFCLSKDKKGRVEVKIIINKL